MSVVINSNAAATVAWNNLAVATELYLKSLNRLSSGSKILTPADDAGGLAVSMMLSAAARRQEAASANLGNAVSYLQNQDSGLRSAAGILGRIGELKTLYADPTKNSSDLANYDVEFVQLQAQLSSLSGRQFNGTSLFGSTTMSVPTDADSSSHVTFGGTDLLRSTPTPAFTTLSDNFANLGNWSDVSSGGGSSATASNILSLSSGAGGTGAVQSAQSFSGPFDVNLDVRFTGSGGTFSVQLGGSTLLSYVASDTNSHSLKIRFDGNGNAAGYLDDSSTAFATTSDIVASSGSLELSHTGGTNGAEIQSFSIASTATDGSATADVSTALNLGALDLSTITSATQEVASYRADNGGLQSRLGFAGEVLTINRANVAAANSRISDVDVAEESTRLARYSILMQNSIAMLAQANESAQLVLKLIG
jgi:flagellin